MMHDADTAAMFAPLNSTTKSSFVVPMMLLERDDDDDDTEPRTNPSSSNFVVEIPPATSPSSSTPVGGAPHPLLLSKSHVAIALRQHTNNSNSRQQGEYRDDDDDDDDGVDLGAAVSLSMCVSGDHTIPTRWCDIWSIVHRIHLFIGVGGSGDNNNRQQLLSNRLVCSKFNGAIVAVPSFGPIARHFRAVAVKKQIEAKATFEKARPAPVEPGQYYTNAQEKFVMFWTMACLLPTSLLGLCLDSVDRGLPIVLSPNVVFLLYLVAVFGCLLVLFGMLYEPKNAGSRIRKTHVANFFYCFCASFGLFFAFRTYVDNGPTAMCVGLLLLAFGTHSLVTNVYRKLNVDLPREQELQELRLRELERETKLKQLTASPFGLECAYANKMWSPESPNCGVKNPLERLYHRQNRMRFLG